ncbi:TSL-kinase interacting protein 1-like isoform X2 [Phragmites australis]|uniref:TSL-kinase interacting protein 1-like isoform X2 n=1 Tax=Phragmites australis TaxID=29695 RepID=UPI002D773C4E|nr:TSL-kinase interacting protein 1-like isoform X2 [Phragmites australis]
MKADQQHCNATDTGAKTKLGCNKLQSLKPNTHINKSSGNIAEKCRMGACFSPGQSYTESEISLKTGSLMGAPFSDSKKLSARPLNHSGKIKLQLFPIDETIQKILQQDKRNPYLELTLTPRKKISSVVQHLNRKWGSSQCAKGELMLFPYDARLDSITGSEKWTLQDSCTAADVHVAVGSPSTFRLRYGWFELNLKQQSSGSSLAPVHSIDNTIGNTPSDLVFSEQKHMVGSSEFPSNFVAPSIVDNTNTVQAVDNQSKVAPLSWIDCISNISFGALLSEAAPSQDSKQLPSQNNLSLQQIPVTCDSFDADIASLIARQQASNQPRVSNPSLWDAEETCHAFAFQNQTSKRTSTSVPGNSGATINSSVLGAIPETGTDDDQHESSGNPELGASCSRLLSGTDSLGLSSLLTNSLDAFQNFSVS